MTCLIFLFLAEDNESLERKIRELRSKLHKAVDDMVQARNQVITPIQDFVQFYLNQPSLACYDRESITKLALEQWKVFPSPL